MFIDVRVCAPRGTSIGTAASALASTERRCGADAAPAGFSNASTVLRTFPEHTRPVSESECLSGGLKNAGDIS